MSKILSFMINKTINIPEKLAQAHELRKKNNLTEAIALLEKVNDTVEHSGVVRTLSYYLMDSLDYQRVVELPHVQKYDIRNYIVANSFVNGDINSTAPLHLKGHKVLEKAAFISMVKDEEDIIFFNLIWHYGLGLRKFFIIDNLSTDRTLEFIKLFEQLHPDAEVFILHDPVVAHYQGKKVTGACRFAKTLWSNLEWLVLADADEFLCPTRPLHRILNSVPKTIDAIIIPKSFYNLVPGESTEDSDFFFRRLAHRTPVTHVSSKAIMRAKDKFTVSQGNHHIHGPKGHEIQNYTCNLDLTYREFRMRSYAHHRRKVINGGKAVQAAKQQGFAQVGGDHWAAVYNLYLKEGDKGLQRHFENIIKGASNKTTLLDPLPLEKIVAAMDSSKKISQLLV